MNPRKLCTVPGCRRAPSPARAFCSFHWIVIPPRLRLDVERARPSAVTIARVHVVAQLTLDAREERIGA